ncbi:PssE/Cps14G family polysaccharide biosynthesis glycosyltransferase [uncultured Clostridium sp.]|uniref:PssE/Cps14G family polysaccharide biosynthesis glycosyltransferase n=1 Tax=uncultured Clostridium sp. TaxID=59620 RepID=UPI0025F32988|nr:PssE/Cps14G family polysaccharide biosynthesis glycosyltransferase [uncultured Clostridium sp.]
MIFITLGSQKFQFNRLLIEIDELVEGGKITEEVFAQIGYSDYKPKNYNYREFIDRVEFLEIMDKCDKVITHGGTGAIISAVKKGKKVIAIPRLSKFDEHVDDHQLQIVKQFKNMNFINYVKNEYELGEIIKNIDKESFQKYNSNTFKIINSIDEFIEST